MKANNLFYQIKSQAYPVFVLLPCPIKGFKNTLQYFFLNRRAGIFYKKASRFSSSFSF